MTAHVGAQRLGNDDGAVGLLVVFENGEPGAAHGQAAAVEGVDEFGSCPCDREGLKRMLARRAWKASKLEQEEISR